MTVRYIQLALSTSLRLCIPLTTPTLLARNIPLKLLLLAQTTELLLAETAEILLAETAELLLAETAELLLA